MKTSLFSYSRAAQLLSGLCLIHCISMPLIIAIMPGLSALIHHDYEIWLTLSVVPIAIAGFLPTWNRHRNIPIGLSFAAGLLLMLAGSLFLSAGSTIQAHLTAASQANVLGSIPLHTIFSVSGALLLSYTMFRNNRHVHTCNNPLHKH